MRKLPAATGAQGLSSSEDFSTFLLLSLGMSCLPEDDHGEKAVPAQEAKHSAKQRRIERNQTKRAHPEILEGGFNFRPSDEDLSLGNPVRKKPLGRIRSGLDLPRFRYSWNAACNASAAIL